MKGWLFEAQDFMGRATYLGVFLLLLQLLGCSGDEEAVRQPQRTAEAPVVVDVTKPVAEPGDGRLRLGMARIVVHADGRVSVVANDAARLEILKRLAQAANFDLKAYIDSWGRLTTKLERLSLRDALPTLVGDVEYQAEWSFDAQGDRYTLMALTIGNPPPPTPVADPLRDEALEEAEERAVVREDLRRILDERPAIHLDPDQLLEGLGDPDPRVRMEAAVEIDPEGEAFNQLIDMLANDQNAGVRAATTVSLENSDQIAAVNALLAALRDPSPVVVVEVIDSLEFAGDASIVPQLTPLLEHRDRGVREAAFEAIEFLKEPDDEG